MAKMVTVELKIADQEPFKSFAKGAADAAAMFATLTEAERGALPDAALFGIARLRGAIAEFTGEDPELPAVALEPDMLPNRPLTADRVEPLISKEIG